MEILSLQEAVLFLNIEYRHYDSNLAVYSNAPIVVYNDKTSEVLPGVAISNEYGNSRLNYREIGNVLSIKQTLSELAQCEIVVIPRLHGIEVDGVAILRKQGNGSFTLSFEEIDAEYLSPRAVQELSLIHI